MTDYLQLSDGSYLEIPEGMNDDALKNLAMRAEAQIKTEAPKGPTASAPGPPYTDDKFTAADLDRLKSHSDWIVANKDKAGTPEFVKAADAYRSLRRAYDDAQDRAEWAKPNNSYAAGASAFMSGLNKGVVADTLGAPVDAANWGLRKMGLPTSDKPFMGSDWISGKMQDANMIQPSRGWDKTAHAGELIGSGVGNAALGGVAAPKLAAAGLPKLAAVADAMGPGAATGGSASPTVAAGLRLMASPTVTWLQSLTGFRGRFVGNPIGNLFGSLWGPNVHTGIQPDTEIGN